MCVKFGDAPPQKKDWFLKSNSFKKCYIRIFSVYQKYTVQMFAVGKIFTFLGEEESYTRHGCIYLIKKLL